MKTDVESNRKMQKWTRREQAGRILWMLIQPLFSLSPRPLWNWRRFLLKCLGAKIGQGVNIHPTVRITIPWNLSIGDHSAVGDRAILYALGPISIGERVTVSQNAHLCAGSHDWRQPSMPLTKRPILIEDDAWVCADAFIGPGVTIGSAAIVGARGVAMRNVARGDIVTGNPAEVVGQRA